MNWGSEEDRLKGEKRHVDESKEEVIGDGKHHRFGQHRPERWNGSVGIVRVQSSSIWEWVTSFHSLNGGLVRPIHYAV